ncbi:MAG: DUF177 domain-containing protein [Desulfobulbaceae bacterium]|jgi:uncharacterized protein|nr:DUF177 domain-containing protein [Desulfobulbaceae bacterium]
MKVRFGEIPDEGLRFEIKDESWFPDHELQRSGPVLAIVVLKRNGVDRVLLEGEIKTTLAFDCDRCLENYSMELDSSFKLDLEYAAGHRLDTAEHEVSPAEMDMIYLEEPVVDVFEILSQQIFLMVPGKHLCSESCKGLCPRCGANLNEEACDCKQELKSSPFAILKKVQP